MVTSSNKKVVRSVQSDIMEKGNRIVLTAAMNSDTSGGGVTLIEYLGAFALAKISYRALPN
jgi:hypothetical protein